MPGKVKSLKSLRTVLLRSNCVPSKKGFALHVPVLSLLLPPTERSAAVIAEMRHASGIRPARTHTLRSFQISLALKAATLEALKQQ